MSVPISQDLPFWSVHTHSRYSANDALPKVADVVKKAVSLGYPALGLTDHGTISGAVQLYKECRKAGIEPLPGVELYVTSEHEQGVRSNDHMTVVAYTETGYRNLVTLNNVAQRNFHYKPRVDMADLAELAEAGKTAGLAVSTGCYFGVVTQALLNQGPQAAKQIVEALAGWFPKVYVELQHHGTGNHNGPGYSEDDILDELVYLADELGMPYILAQDSHYTEAEHQPLHDGLKGLVSFSDDVSEAIFPGGPYSMVDSSYFRGRMTPYVLGNALANLHSLAQKASVRLPELEVFSMKVPDVSLHGEPYNEMAGRAMQALSEKELAADRYSDVLEVEFDVIDAADIAGYLLLVADVCRFMREKGIWYRARGSAGGSLVCYLLGITQVDPVAGGLRFDRFLSRDRTRPPDIDLDVEHERRDEVVAYLEERFSVRQVGSHMQYSMTNDEEVDEGGGSLLVKYYSKHRKPGDPAITWKDVPASDRAMLKQLGSMKLISGPGTHAAGYIVAPDEASVAELPVTWMANRKAYVTSYGKKDVEALGFVKLDLLGLRTLTAIRITCEAITTHDPQAFWDEIPWDDKATMARISKGNTEGVFQLEGKASTFGCKDLKPRKMADLIAAQALFRPAAMQSGATKQYMARRRKEEQIPVRHPDIMDATAETYGTLLYQEQVISVVRAMGMPADELTDLLDAVKASNEASEGARGYLEQVKPRIRQLAYDAGWKDVDIEWLLDALVAYAEYSFNKAHASQYGEVAYKTAYLAEHHPVEFWLGMLVAFQGAKRGKRDLEAEYVRAARKYGVRIKPAHVNTSGATYKLDGQAIRKGLTAIKNVGKVAAAEIEANAPYKSLTDLGERVLAKKVGGAKGLALKKPPAECGGAIAALHDYGALDGLEAE